MQAELRSKQEADEEKKQQESERRTRIADKDKRLKQFLHAQNERTRRDYEEKIKSIEKKDRDAAERKKKVDAEGQLKRRVHSQARKDFEEMVKLHKGEIELVSEQRRKKLI